MLNSRPAPASRSLPVHSGNGPAGLDTRSDTTLSAD